MLDGGLLKVIDVQKAKSGEGVVVIIIFVLSIWCVFLCVFCVDGNGGHLVIGQRSLMLKIRDNFCCCGGPS